MTAPEGGRGGGHDGLHVDGLRVDRHGVDRLREDLAAATWTVEGLEALLGPVAAGALHREQVVPARRVLAGAASPTAVLTRLFVLAEDVRRADVARALPRLGVEGAERLGLLSASGHGDDDAVRAVVDLRPYEAEDDGGVVRWWIASDQGEAVTGRPLRPDHVLGVGGASLTLARLTVRTPRRRTLDLGTGCGIQALHAARHSAAVVATDVSARALATARFNAALAGVDVDLRQGSLLEPVDGRFDLVVSNPPFVITPRDPAVPLYEYRDAGLAGDDLVRSLVRDLGGVLAPGGVAQLLGNWEHHRDQPWRERVGEWLDGTGLDAWVVQREVLDPAEYAETWLRDGGTAVGRDRAAWERGLRSWLEDFEARGVTAVGLGAVLLRRPEHGSPTLRRLEEVTSQAPSGDQLAAVLAAHDRLTALDDAALLAQRLRVAPDVTEERHHVPGAADPSVVLLRQGGGFGRTVQVGTAAAALVGACDGELTVGQLCCGIAALLDVGADDLMAELVPLVRDLTRDGFLRLEG